MHCYLHTNGIAILYIYILYYCDKKYIYYIYMCVCVCVYVCEAKLK